MSEVVADFIRALREADVRVSPSESIDAGETLATLGYSDRALLREGLTLALAKSVPEKRLFDETFDDFFKFDLFTEPNSDAAPPERSELAQGDTQTASTESSALLSILERGDRAELQARLAEAARKTDVDDIRYFTQRGMYVLRIMQDMGVGVLDDAIAAARGWRFGRRRRRRRSAPASPRGRT